MKKKWYFVNEFDLLLMIQLVDVESGIENEENINRGPFAGTDAGNWTQQKVNG